MKKYIATLFLLTTLAFSVKSQDVGGINSIPIPTNNVIYLPGTNWVIIVDYKPKVVKVDDTWVIVLEKDKK